MKVIVKNQLIEYQDEGSGRVLLLLHGWGTDLTTFDQLNSHLVKKFRVLRFDFPGFGKSPKPTEDWSISNYADLTRDLLQKLKIKQVYAVIGHSFGGRVVIKGIGHGYLKPDKVILMGAAGVKPHQEIKKALYKSIAKVGRFATSIPVVNKLQPALRRRLYNSAGSTDYLQANQMQQIFVNVVNEDLLPEVPKITQPTLLIWGEDDTETPLSDARKIKDLLSDGRIFVVPNVGHFVYIDAFSAVTKEIDKFLS